MPELRLKCLQLEIQLKIEQKRVEKNARRGKPVFGLAKRPTRPTTTTTTTSKQMPWKKYTKF